MKTVKDSKRFLLIYTVTVLATTLVATILRCLNLFFFFDAKIGYYSSGAILPVLEAVILAASVLFFAVVSIFLLRRAPIGYGDTVKKPLRVCAMLAAVLCLVFACVRVIGEDNTALLSRLLLLLSIIAAVYFLLHAGTIEVPSLPRFITGLCVILWLLLALASSYFDVTVQMNAPDKLLFQLACLSGMIFTVSELRMLIDTPRTALYLFSTGCASLFMGTASIPSLIAGYANAMEKPSWFFCNIILFGMFVYTVARLISLTVAFPFTPADPIAEPDESEENGKEDQTDDSREDA